MHKFYWNNKQPPRGGLNSASHGHANNATTDTVFDKPRHNAHQPMSDTNTKGNTKMAHSKSEFNFNSIKNVSGTDTNVQHSKTTNSSREYGDSVNPALPKRSDGGIKTVVRVTSSPLKTEESSTKHQLTSSKSHSDMRTHLQSNNQYILANKSDEGQASNTQSSSNGNKTNKAPVGSHRVLLKLRRLSGKDTRPKSVHGVDQISIEGGKNGKNNSNDNKTATDQSDSISLKGMSTSRSMHQFYFYNRTWNERSLQKYTSNNSHNYENVYSGFQESEDGSTRVKAPPVYENITVASEYQQNAMASNNPLIINTLTCSPKSSIRNGSRISIIPSDYNKDLTTNSRIVQNSSHNWDQASSFNQHESHTPIPPERKGRRTSRNGNILDNGTSCNNEDNNFNKYSNMMNNENNHRQLYRSKSCERPKMKDSVRDTFKLLSNETSDRLQNNFNRISSNFTDKFLTSNSIMNKFACGSGSGNGSTRSSNSSYNGKSGSNSSKMSTGSSDFGSSKNSSSTSYNSNNETALQATNLQAVGIKNFIPCVDIQVRKFFCCKLMHRYN